VPLSVYLCVRLPGASVSFDHSMNKSFPEGFPKGSDWCVVVFLHIRWSVVQVRVA